MRVGDFSVEVIATDGDAWEIESGHVLARPGQVYRLRLRNHGPLRAVADISIDGRSVTGGGLVLSAWSVVDLERPIHPTERGRVTIIAEGNERVLGPDGGRDNPDLGLIEARFRRELPSASRPPVSDPMPTGFPRPGAYPPRPAPAPEPRRSDYPRIMSYRASQGGIRGPLGGESDHDTYLGALEALIASPSPLAEPTAPAQPEGPPRLNFPAGIERAAGTGLTGASDQEFMTVHVGSLESEPTVIKLRIVIATEEALAEPRPLPHMVDEPARPVARP